MTLTVLVFLSCKLLCFSCQLPYEYLTPLQAAIGVVQKVFFFLKHHSRVSYKFWGKRFMWLNGNVYLQILIFSYQNFKWISGFTTHHPQEHSSEVCWASWEVLAARSYIETWFLRNYRDPAAVSKGGIARLLLCFLGCIWLLWCSCMCVIFFPVSTKVALYFRW